MLKANIHPNGTHAFITFPSLGVTLRSLTRRKS